MRNLPGRTTPSYVTGLVQASRINPEQVPAIWARAERSHVRKEGTPVPPAVAHLVRMQTQLTAPEMVERVRPTTTLIVTRVTALRYPVRPADFTRAVLTIVIDPVERHTWRTRPDSRLDVRDKQPGVVPALTDLDATSAVILVAYISRVVAPMHHLGPGAVKRMKFAALREPVCRQTSPQASARASRMSVRKVVARDFVSSSAVTHEFRPAPLTRCFGLRHVKYFQDHASADSVARLYRARSLAHRFSPALIRTGTVEPSGVSAPGGSVLVPSYRGRPLDAHCADRGDDLSRGFWARHSWWCARKQRDFARKLKLR